MMVPQGRSIKAASAPDLPNTTQGAKATAKDIQNVVLLVSILPAAVDSVLDFCLMADLQKSNSTLLSFFHVSESSLKPNQAIESLVEGVTVRSDELSRALTPLVLEFVKKKTVYQFDLQPFLSQ